MSEQEKFLERWSRRKAEAERADADAAAKAQPAASPVAATDSRAAADAGPKSPVAPASEFDLASLPPLESITELTDVRSFLVPGVPPELTRAALRRAWAADPAIRNFVGLQENDWDFANPVGVPGFSELPPGYDVKKLLAQIFGEAEKEADKAKAVSQSTAAAADPQATAPSKEIVTSDSAVEAAPSSDEQNRAEPAGAAAEQAVATEHLRNDLVQRNNNIALHNTPGNRAEHSKSRRQHGGALPE
jgi:hypothetical protein